MRRARILISALILASSAALLVPQSAEARGWGWGGGWHGGAGALASPYYGYGSYPGYYGGYGGYGYPAYGYAPCYLHREWGPWGPRLVRVCY